MLQLVPNRNDVPPSGKTNAEKPGQCRDQAHCLSGLFIFYHPDNDVQGIVQKMGIDLGLKGVELCLSLGLMLRRSLLRQALHLPDHFLHRFT